jgi:acyl-coenzyme A synthetase/AMP-(fatty) acid ligase/acyl carrier protein
LNHFGPSEYSVLATAVTVAPAGGEARSGPPSVGWAIANTRSYVLDARLAPVPAGVAGELCLAGVGLARGYLHRPDGTAERFAPDPWGALHGEPGARMYRTGDLVRRLPDGDLDFLGRIDHQVKLRGMRVELGEIEAALARHPGVRETAVLLREDRPGDRRLAAYVVPSPSAGPEIGALRSFLGELLPALPLTPNGKLDRRALPLPERLENEGYVAPRTPLEEEVAAIWAQVLGVERVGIHDSFWDLGGHSLLATQMLSRLLRVFGVEISLRTFFEQPTVAGLLLVVAEELLREESPAAMPV